MIPNIVLQATGSSPQWWLVGWGLSIFMLVVGFYIGVTYYDTNDESKTHNQVGA